MDGLMLLKRARAAGLRVDVDGDKLRVIGPKRLEPLALEVLSHKAELWPILTASEITVADLTADWRIEFEERAAIREYDGGQAREHAEAEALTEIVQRMRIAGELPSDGVTKLQNRA